MIDRKRLKEMGVPEDMTADDVKAFFSLPDEDDSMHQETGENIVTELRGLQTTCPTLHGTFNAAADEIERLQRLNEQAVDSLSELNRQLAEAKGC